MIATILCLAYCSDNLWYYQQNGAMKGNLRHKYHLDCRRDNSLYLTHIDVTLYTELGTLYKFIKESNLKFQLTSTVMIGV